MFGGAGTNDAQQTAIKNFIASINKLQTQIDDARVQIAIDKQSGKDTAAQEAQLGSYEQKLADAQSDTIAAFTQKYHTDVIDGQGNWYGDLKYQTEHPDFKPSDALVPGALENTPTDKVLKYWNYVNNRPEGLVQNPNQGSNKTYSMDLPEGIDVAGIVVDGFVSTHSSWVRDEERDPIDTAGIVASLGQPIKIESRIVDGEIKYSTPDIKKYIYSNSNIPIEQFAASISSPSFALQDYAPTPNNRFNDFWTRSADGNTEFFANATWGARRNSAAHGGEDIGGFTVAENGNSRIEPTQFPAKYDSACYFGGQVIIKSGTDSTENGTTFTVITFVKGGMLEGEIPDLNDSRIRELLSSYSSPATQDN